MEKPGVLDRFFKEQHRKALKRSYAVLQDICGHCSHRSEYGTFLRRKASDLPGGEKAHPGEGHDDRSKSEHPGL